MLREASYYTRMALGYYQLRRMPLEPNPRAFIRRSLRNRESNFLDLMKRAVFEHPTNPYHTLFAWAGCTYGDLEKGVRADGIETTLESLRKAGVYLEHDEFKGKRPIERSGKQLASDPVLFRNPLVKGVLETSSSGSRSSGTITRRSLEFHYYREAQDRVFLDELEFSKHTIIRVGSILPSSGGVRRALIFPRRGDYVDRWFALGGSMKDSAHYRLLTQYLVLQARLLGVKATFPTFLPQNDFSPVAKRVALMRSRGRDTLLSVGVSNGVRVAAVAAELGLDISGTRIRVHGEALTPAKRAAIQKVGATPFPGYTISELGKIGGSCSQLRDGNCVHICLDSVAVISRRRMAPLTQVEVDSLLFTSLLPEAATVLINVEMDDAGTLGDVRCSCSLSALGLTRQISNIFSYGKLTGQGMTLMGGDLLNMLENILPGKFGGSPTDYQLVEQEGEQQTEIELRVHPSATTASEESVKQFFLSELTNVYGGSLSRRNWVQTNGVRVVFAEPYRTPNEGKMHPLHLLGTGERQRAS